ncbi:MAG TPA: alpha-amylase family glycosyl hydrolase, partial [Salinimicrobium sp.]|nr:alpha-amylase family glycosyl hydrolase [Salinimicrobium sp.]
MEKKVGVVFLKDNTYKFSVWAPMANEVHVVFKDEKETVPLQKKERGYWQKKIAGIKKGSLYKLKLDNKKELPDPASKSQPEGVHSWSQVLNLTGYSWNDMNWKGIPISEMIIYELHVGTFSEKGTFEGVSEKLDQLLELGINTIEIMPVAQFPGDRNWGYDGVYPYAVQQSYGGAAALQQLIDTCHQKGIAVLLDVVYNHQGPEGNYLSEFGPYFTQKYKTPWGSAINFDDEYSDEVRNFFLQNALMWIENFHFDGLRL